MKDFNIIEWLYCLLIVASAITAVIIIHHGGGLAALAWSSPLSILGLISVYALLARKSYRQLPRLVRLLFVVALTVSILLAIGVLFILFNDPLKNLGN
jgi:hypothetical protein